MAFANSNRVAQAPAIDLSAVFFFVGVIVCAFGGAMLLPAVVDLADNNADYRVFLTCSAMTMFGGLSMALAFRRAPPRHGHSRGDADGARDLADRRELREPAVRLLQLSPVLYRRPVRDDVRHHRHRLDRHRRARWRADGLAAVAMAAGLVRRLRDHHPGGPGPAVPAHRRHAAVRARPVGAGAASSSPA